MEEKDKPNHDPNAERKIRQNKIAYASIGLFAFGAIVIFFTYTPLLQAYQWEQHPTCDDLLICKSAKSAFTRSNTGITTTIVDEIYQTVTFSSRGVFTVNQKIDYEITVNATKITQIKKIYFLFITDKELSGLLTFEPYQVLEREPWKHRLIETPATSENKFHTKGIWETPSIPSDIIVVGYGI